VATAAWPALDLPALVQAYGLWAVAAGTFAEGETVLLLGGFFAHRGYMNPVSVWLVATAASFLGDQLWFWLGRERGRRMVGRWPRLAEGVDRADPYVSRHPMLAAVAVRFLYGFRLAGPVALGMTSMPAGAFALANLLGASLWALLFTALGWTFGLAATRVFDDVRHHEGWLALVLAVVSLAGWILWRRRSAARAVPADAPPAPPS
jgi:membrane protein DedA with SNARE-associated domain